ncbi:MAG: hypothetical protein U5R31_00575 [Acidimicrobiia bacterium]|nr:hypothetical protein [Acidimicrobiia bacterium]
MEWIGDIYWDPEVEAKLRQKHQLTPAQVFDAVGLGAQEQESWHTDERYGERLLAIGSDDQGRMIVYLRPGLDEGSGQWDGLTAWRL